MSSCTVPYSVVFVLILVGLSLSATVRAETPDQLSLYARQQVYLQKPAANEAVPRVKLNRRALLKSILLSWFPEKRLWSAARGNLTARQATYAPRNAPTTSFRLGLAAAGIRMRLNAHDESVGLSLGQVSDERSREILFSFTIGW